MNLSPQELQLALDRGLIIESFDPKPRGNGLIAYDANRIAFDAQQTTVTTANSDIPALFTTAIDPETIEVLFTPNEFANICTERLEGDWAMDTFEFPIREFIGEVSSYDDMSESGMVTVNYNWENRQAYNYQTHIGVGQRAVDRMGKARQNLVADMTRGAIVLLNKEQNLIYAYGVAGEQNYGLLNDPNLPAASTAANKANGGTTWFVNTSQPNASPNEVYNDVFALFTQLVAQSAGIILITKMDKLTLALGPTQMNALKFVNSFGLTVESMINGAFPNMRIVAAIQYEDLSSSNPQGNAAGNFMQMICEGAGGQTTLFAAYNEKLRAHTMVQRTSSFVQKYSQGAYGTIIKQPYAVASMLGT